MHVAMSSDDVSKLPCLSIVRFERGGVDFLVMCFISWKTRHTLSTTFTPSMATTHSLTQSTKSLRHESLIYFRTDLRSTAVEFVRVKSERFLKRAFVRSEVLRAFEGTYSHFGITVFTSSQMVEHSFPKCSLVLDSSGTGFEVISSSTVFE